MMFTFPLAAYAKKVIERAELSIVIGTKRAPNGASIDTTGYAYPAGSLVTRAYADSRAAESFAGAAELDGGMVAGSITTPYSGGAGNQTIKVDVTDLVKNNIYNGVFNALVYNMISGSGTWGVVYSKESSNVPVLSLTYSEYMPKTETVYPKDVYTKQGEDIEFIWGFSSQSDAVLASSRIEYSKNGINFALLAEVAGAVSSFRYDGGAWERKDILAGDREGYKRDNRGIWYDGILYHWETGHTGHHRGNKRCQAKDPLERGRTISV